jgi:hypothetical protein
MAWFVPPNSFQASSGTGQKPYPGQQQQPVGTTISGQYNYNGSPNQPLQPSYYNTFVQPMVPQPQQGLQGTGPTDPTKRYWGDTQSSQNSSDNWSTPSPTGMGGYNGQGQGPQTPINTQQAFQGLGTPDLHDHSQLMKLADNLKQQGHNVQPGGIDQYGRMDSLYIDGELHKVFDSTNHWIMQASPGGYSDAWGSDGSQGGNQGTMPSQGMQNDPNAWRRQHEMRQHQTPQYGGGYSGYNGSGPFVDWGPNGPGPIAGGGFGTNPIRGGGWGVENPNQGGFNTAPANGGVGLTGLQGTAPSAYANTFGQPTSHPMNQRLMY